MNRGHVMHKIAVVPDEMCRVCPQNYEHECRAYSIPHSKEEEAARNIIPEGKEEQRSGGYIACRDNELREKFGLITPDSWKRRREAARAGKGLK
jgi:hypothetical protein